jgi:hypothetical protein
MKKDTVWFVICGKTRNYFMIAYLRCISFGVAEFLGCPLCNDRKGLGVSGSTSVTSG